MNNFVSIVTSLLLVISSAVVGWFYALRNKSRGKLNTELEDAIKDAKEKLNNTSDSDIIDSVANKGIDSGDKKHTT
jgi:hypothetical protein